MSAGEAWVPGTCGELFQGTLDGEPCLVSCPIDRFGFARIELHEPPDWTARPDRTKAWTALQAGLAHGGTVAGGCFEIRSDLPQGRGYGSSTADVGATLFALSRALPHPLPMSDVAQIAVAVEPTDSTLFPELAVFCHRSARWHEPLGAAPPLEVVVLDPGGEVDTVRFNQADHGRALRRLASTHAGIFERLKQALRHQDWPGVGAAATESAQAHQRILDHDLGDRAFRLARDVGAQGVCRAHSGTIWGLLLDPSAVDVEAVEAYVAARAPRCVAVARQRLVGGGPRHRTLGALAESVA